jgi:hypothetical protein
MRHVQIQVSKMRRGTAAVLELQVTGHKLFVQRLEDMSARDREIA